jgi:hypothetical protein
MMRTWKKANNVASVVHLPPAGKVEESVENLDKLAG